ncbi:MAG: hybrid sensor histidine kinase/response regulator, partial [Cyanobacteria bacterium J083]
LYDLIQELLIQWQPLVQESKAQIVNLISPDLPLVNVDRHRLLRVYENLIMNALKHNPPGIELIFAAEVDIRQNILRCIVADNGVGIEATHRENLFKLYHKGKTGNSLSLGLGLYLCRQIIEAHGGVMGIETNLSVGSQFWFTLPLTPI